MALSLEVAQAVAVWLEGLLYGIYVCLFFEAMFVMLRRKGAMQPPAKFFFGGVILMFIAATTHMAVNVYRLLRGYVLHVDPLGPGSYLSNFSRWDNMANLILTSIMVWLGDILVIYRCYLIWNRKIWVTILPVILLLFGIGSNAALFFWFMHPSAENATKSLPWLATVYPISFSQNTITTGMIAFKIWKQHRASAMAGIAYNSSSLSLIDLFRIIIESAMIYTLQQLVLIILYPSNNNAQYIMDAAIIPSVGIVFALIAVRVHFSRSRTLLAPSMMATMPTWLDRDTSLEMGPSTNLRHSVALSTGQTGQGVDHGGMKFPPDTPSDISQGTEQTSL